MALNFPTDTSAPYYDPVSGLKYIYNSSIGAWETAIQPPAVVYPTAPTIAIEGFLWWDETEGRLKIWYLSNGVGAWIDATPTPPPVTVSTSQVPPSEPLEGDLWWDSVNGRMYLYYTDADSSQWVDASPVPDNAMRGNSIITQGTSPPANPEMDDLWFNTESGNLFIYYTDADSSQWVITQNISSQAVTVDSVTATGALSVGGTLKDPRLSIRSATTELHGTARFATSAESTTGTATDVALTPGVLKSTISSYVSGTVDYATTAQTTAGTATDKAVTPAGLKAALPSLGTANPVGTIISFASQTLPTGYIKCDGAAVSRTDYSALFGVIGTTYGIGNGATTFNLPTLTHTNSLIVYCIKH